MNGRTDWRKHRKSTHLASIDLDIMKIEGSSLIFTIKEIKFEKGVNVSGNKMDGFFCYFEEPIKSMKINNSNLLILSEFLGKSGVKLDDIYVVEKYKGLKIELYRDPSVKLFGETVGGIKIKRTQPKLTKIELTPEHPRWSAAKEAIKDGKEKGVLAQFEISISNLELLKK